MTKEGKSDADQFELMLFQLMKNSMGPAAIANVHAEITTIDGVDVCRVHVKPCGFPVDAEVTVVDKQGQHRKETKFYARIGPGTEDFTGKDEEKQKFITQRWPGSI